MIDISALGFQFRGAPVTLMSEGVEELLGRTRMVRAALAQLRWCGEKAEAPLDVILLTATAMADDCIWQSRALGSVPVWIERFGCTFEQGHHEGGEWSVFLPGER